MSSVVERNIAHRKQSTHHRLEGKMLSNSSPTELQGRITSQKVAAKWSLVLRSELRHKCCQGHDVKTTQKSYDYGSSELKDATGCQHTARKTEKRSHGQIRS